MLYVTSYNYSGLYKNVQLYSCTVSDVCTWTDYTSPVMRGAMDTQWIYSVNNNLCVYSVKT